MANDSRGLVRGWVVRVVDFFFMTDQGHAHDVGTHLPYLLLYLFFLVIPFFLHFDTTNQTNESLICYGITLPGSCMSREWFGVDCPGCGLTRSFTAITHGEFGLSYQYHRVGLILYVFFLYQVIYRVYCLCRLNFPIPPLLLTMQNTVPWVVIFMLLANWAVNVIGVNNF